MKVNHKITGAEREVMEVLWQRTEPMQTRELLEEMKERGKKWKRQTLNTLLFRLEEKGIVSRKRAYVEAALSQEELLQVQTQELLDDFYGGEYGNFFDQVQYPVMHVFAVAAFPGQEPFDIFFSYSGPMVL